VRRLKRSRDYRWEGRGKEAQRRNRKIARTERRNKKESESGYMNLLKEKR